MTFAAVVHADGTVVCTELDGRRAINRVCAGWAIEHPFRDGRPLSVWAKPDWSLDSNPLASSIGGLWPHGTIRGTAVVTGADLGDVPSDIVMDLRDLTGLLEAAKRLLASRDAARMR